MNFWTKKVMQKELCPDPFADKVKCWECKCWLDKRDAKSVDVLNVYTTFQSNEGIDYIEYYCHIHKKPYEKKYVYIGIDWNPRYYATVEVNEKGKPV